MKIKSILFTNVENSNDFERWLEHFVEKCLMEQLEINYEQKIELKVSKYWDD